MKIDSQALRSIPLFATLGAPLTDRLTGVADLWRVGPDEVLIREGEFCSELFFLLSGYVLSTQAHSRTGEETPIDLVAPIAALELSSVLLGVPALAGIRTVTAARLLVLPATDYRDLVATEDALARLALEHALRGTRSLAAEICDLKLRTAAQRLAAFLLRLIVTPELTPARFVLPFEKRFIAARLGCSQENLSRALAKLRPLGVDTRGGAVVVRDITALREFAGVRKPP